MSKAFLPGDGDNLDEDLEDESIPAPPLGGGKNPITPGGFARLKAELKHLRFKERPEVTRVVAWAAGNGDRSENADYQYGKRRLREIDRRIRFLNSRLQIAEVVDPTKVKTDQVQFGATVTILDEDDQEKTYRIVGVDEIDVELGKISWASPLGTALLKSREGDCITFRTPKGVKEIEIVRVEYVEIE